MHTMKWYIFQKPSITFGFHQKNYTTSLITITNMAEDNAIAQYRVYSGCFADWNEPT